jgi:hypothetical protein
MLQIQQQILAKGINEEMPESTPIISPPSSAGFSLLFIRSQLRKSGWRKPDKSQCVGWN